ncbi:structural protein [Cragig virus 1]|uniref:structural protein n=1 Tax=Cragig virus 1 TaxID=2480172 RepID=UPI000F0C7E6A|nr:structural protein [Cragig virus 1]AYN75542.1 structural protein [Cragig virus 1]
MDFLILNGSVKKHSPTVSGDYKHLFLVEVQSTNNMIHSDNTMHTFVEEPPQSQMRAIDTGISATADISNFLNRKVKLTSLQWSVGGNVGFSFDPWAAYLGNAAVLNKIQNYQLLKANMKLTFMINGTPFHKGMVLASYSYLDTFNEIVTIGGDSQCVPRSQRPHVYLNPSTNKSGCICVPFFVPTNYLSLTNATISAASIGRVDLNSFQPLEQINAGTDTVTITVFGELSDVKLTAPTMVAVSLSGCSIEDFTIFSLEAQSGVSKEKDEYSSDGVISGPASAVANAAGALSTVPGIGPYAMATHIGANAISSIARLFGFSKPVQLSDTMRMYNTPLGNLALGEGADMSQKLTVTGKQEITVDPRTVDLPDADSLAILPFAQRESYVTKFSWGVADVVDDVIFAMDVDPMAERRSALTLGTQIIPTSLSFLSRPFAEWSGTLKYRFQVLGSQYHRGRIAIVYDPTGPLTGDPYNVTYNTIIDLAEGRDFTVEFKWQKDRAYLSIDTANSRTFWTETTPATRVPDSQYANGIFYVRVVNELVVPDAVTGVDILVSISAGDDFELVNPMGGTMEVFPYVPVAPAAGFSKENFDIFDVEVQSGVSLDIAPAEENSPEGELNQINTTTGVMSDDSEKPLVFYGEKITSIRQLLKRYCHFRLVSNDNAGTSRILANFLMRQMPAPGGYDPASPDTTGAGVKYWYNNNNYINYYKLCFAGWRGSIRWKFLPISESELVYVDRATGPSQRAAASNFRVTSSQPIALGAGATGPAHSGMSSFQYSGSGCALTPCKTMNALEVEVPYHLPIRFSYVHNPYMAAATNTLANGYPGGDSFHLTFSSAVGKSEVTFDTYVAGGEDLTFFGFVGAPTLYSAPYPAP